MRFMSAYGAAFKNLEIMVKEETSDQARLSPSRDRVNRSCLIDVGTQIGRQGLLGAYKEPAKRARTLEIGIGSAPK